MSKQGIWPHLAVADVNRSANSYVAALGFSDPGTAVLDRHFAVISKAGFEVRLELWRFEDWAPYQPGLGIRTLWMEVESVAAVQSELDAQHITYDGPSLENYGSLEPELFDPDGHRIIVSEPRPLAAG